MSRIARALQDWRDDECDGWLRLAHEPDVRQATEKADVGIALRKHLEVVPDDQLGGAAEPLAGVVRDGLIDREHVRGQERGKAQRTAHHYASPPSDCRCRCAFPAHATTEEVSNRFR